MIASTSRAAAELMAGGNQLGSMISSHVLAFSRGAVGMAMIAKLKTVAAVVLVALLTMAAAAWKAPLYEQVVASGRLAAKPSTPFQSPPPHNYMHAKVVVADDVVLTGSYNCSHSGEFNAENLIEVRSAPFADRCAAFCEQVHARYAR